MEGRRKGQIAALAAIDRLLVKGVRFGCALGDAEYGKAAAFRHGLSERGLVWALGIAPNPKVYPADVTLSWPAPQPNGRPRKHPVPSAKSIGVAALFQATPETTFRTLSWRRGTKGPLQDGFATLRVRIADGGRRWPTRSTCRATRSGWWWASIARPASASTTSRTCRPTLRSSGWPC